MLAACLAKEISVFILPGLLWFIVVYPQPDSSLIQRLQKRWFVLMMPIAGIAGYFVMRNIAIVRDSGINKVLAGVSATSATGGFDLLDKIRIFFKVYGFYFKKLFVPWPLNFAIIDISGWYVLAGIVLAGLLVWFFLRADIFGALGLIAFCVLSPAILLPFSKMTWTPLAERYLYVSIAFFAPMVAMWILWFAKRYKIVCWGRSHYVLVIILIVFFTTTLHRAWIWQDNERLFADTVKKSPEFLPVKSELASALIRKGRRTEAEALLTAMQSNSGSNSFLIDNINLAQSLMGEGELIKARNLLIDYQNKPGKRHHIILQTLLKINNKRLGVVDDPAERNQIKQESLSWLLEQQRIRPNSFTLYRIGKMQSSLGNDQAALLFFKRSYAGSPLDSHYRAATKKYIDRLH